MRMKFKGFLTGIAVFVLMLAGAVIVHAAGGSITFGSSSYTVTEGEEFNIGVYMRGDVNIGAYTFNIEYDASKIEYVSGADAGGNGKISFAGVMNSNYKKLWLTFKAKASGSCNITVTEPYLGPVTGADALSISSTGNSPITVKEAGTAAAGGSTLKSLKINGYVPYGGFSPTKTKYDVTVESDVESVKITALPTDSNAKVEITDTTLKVGDNTIYITVTGTDGSTTKYELKVRRKKGDTTNPTNPTSSNTPEPTEPSGSQEPPTLPNVDNKNSYYSYDGENLYFTDSLSGVVIPEGFSETTVNIDGNQFAAMTNASGTIVLYYLVDSAGKNGHLYVCSNANNTVYPYVILENSNYSYMIDEVDNPNIPADYQKISMVIKGGNFNEDVTVVAWYNPAAPDFYLLCASCNGEEPALYQYDLRENTIQRYNMLSASNPGSSADDAAKIKELENKIAELEKNNKGNAGAATFKVIIGIVIALAVIGLAIIIIYFYNKFRDRMEYDSYDDEQDDYDDGENSEEDYFGEDDFKSETANNKRGSYSSKAEKQKYGKQKNSKISADDDNDDDFIFFDVDNDK